MAESNANFSYNCEDQDMTLKQRIEDVIDDIRHHNQSTQLMVSDISDNGLEKTVVRAQKPSKSQKNHKFLNYVLRERKTQL